jgi:hypothetical protein
MGIIPKLSLKTRIGLTLSLIILFTILILSVTSLNLQKRHILNMIAYSFVAEPLVPGNGSHCSDKNEPPLCLQSHQLCWQPCSLSYA